MNFDEMETRKERVLFWVSNFAVCSLMFVILFEVAYMQGVAFDEDYGIMLPLVNEGTGVYMAFVLLPIIVWFQNRYPLKREGIVRRVLVYFVFIILLGLVHTTLMTLIRFVLYPIAGLGEYGGGWYHMRFVFELTKQVPLFWMAVGLFALFRHLKESGARKARTAQLEEKLAKASLDALREQLKPHFLFNTLNLISDKAYEDPAKADELISRLSELLRMSLELGKTQEVPLGSELDFLDGYIEIMDARFEERIRFQKNVDESLLSARIPSLILQPVVENAIKHGLDQSTVPMTLNVSALEEGAFLNIRIENTILHEGEPMKVSSTGIGMGLVKERLENLYPSNHEVSFGDDNLNTYVFCMKIPLSYE